MNNEETLQSLINEHGELFELKNLLMEKVEKKEITEEKLIEVTLKEQSFPNHKELSPELKAKFEEYKNECFIKYQSALSDLIQYFQTKEENPVLHEQALKTFFTHEPVTDKDIEVVEQNLFENFFKIDDQIEQYLVDNQLSLPQSLKKVYNELSSIVEEEYTDWLSVKAQKYQKLKI